MSVRERERERLDNERPGGSLASNPLLNVQVKKLSNNGQAQIKALYNEVTAQKKQLEVCDLKLADFLEDVEDLNQKSDQSMKNLFTNRDKINQIVKEAEKSAVQSIIMEDSC